MAVQIQLNADNPSQRFTITLDGQDYSMLVQYRARTRSYYMSLFLLDGTALFRMRRITPFGVNGGLELADIGGPPGQFVLLGPDDFPQEALGLTAKLYYITGAEVEAARDNVSDLEAGLVVTTELAP